MAVPLQQYNELKDAMEALKLSYAEKMKELGAIQDKFQAQEMALKAAEGEVAAQAVSPAAVVTLVPMRERKLRKFGEKVNSRGGHRWPRHDRRRAGRLFI